MNKIQNLFTYSEEKWKEIQEKGFTRFILYVGLFKTGFIGGILCLFFYYLNSLSFKFLDFSINYFVFNYLVFLPLFLIIGPVVASFSWSEYNKKYK